MFLSSKMRRTRDAFTLFEVMLAVAIAVMLLVIAIPSMSGLFAEDSLRASFDDFDAITREAKKRAMAEKRTILLVWTKDGILLTPEVLQAEDEASLTPQLLFSDEVSVALERPAALVKDPPLEWPFWPSGACEPVRVSYSGAPGKWTAEYEPLTARGTLTASYPR